MRYSLRQFLTYSFGVIALFLLLTHAGGFASSVRSISQGYIGGVKVLQGR